MDKEELITRILRAHEALKKPSSVTFQERLAKSSAVQLEGMAHRLEGELHNRQSTWGSDSRKVINRIMDIRERMAEPVGAYELAQLLRMPKPEVLTLLRTTESRWNAWRDQHGVPVARWRAERGFASPEVIAANGVMPERPSKREASRRLTLDELKELASRRA